MDVLLFLFTSCLSYQEFIDFPLTLFSAPMLKKHKNYENMYIPAMLLKAMFLTVY